jgi:hypothetical protein
MRPQIKLFLGDFIALILLAVALTFYWVITP